MMARFLPVLLDKGDLRAKKEGEMHPSLVFGKCVLIDSSQSLISKQGDRLEFLKA